MAERKYRRSLSPEDRKAYDIHERRKKQYIRLVLADKTFDDNKWGDVVKAPDFEADTQFRIRVLMDPHNPFLMCGWKWSPPATAKSEQARWLKSARAFIERWGEDYEDAHLAGGRYADGSSRWGCLQDRHIDKRREDFNYSLLNAYCPTGVVSIKDDGDDKGWCAWAPSSDSGNAMLEIKRWMLDVRAYKQDIPVMLGMMVGVSKDRGKVCVLQVLSESGRDETQEERKARVEREEQEERERQRLASQDAERQRLALRDSMPSNY